MENIDSKLSEGLRLEKKGKKDEALELYEDISEEIEKNDQSDADESLSFIFNRMANIKKDEDLKEALKLVKKSINYAKNSNNVLQLSKSRITHGIILKDLNKYNKAEKTLNQVINDLQNEDEDSRLNQGLGWTLYTLGNIHIEMNDLNKAKEELNKSIEILESLGDYGGMAAALEKLGDLLKKTNNYEEAIDQYRESINIYDEIGTEEDINNIENKILEVKEQTKNE